MIKNINKFIVATLLIMGLLTACHADEDEKAESSNTGVAKEVMVAGGYTYVLLETNGETRWIAGPKTEVSVGSTISIEPPMPMSNFKSTALDRKFKMIYFTGKIHSGDGSKMASSMSHQSMPGMAQPGAADPHAGVDMGKGMSKGMGDQVGSEKTTTPNEHVSAAAKKSEPVKGIKKAENGKTIDDVLKQKKDLDGKLVKIRGKVIKFTEEVMNKNWIHIKDSSTSGDLTITTSGKVKVGDTIIVDGKIAVNKDFGYGYIYDVILEEAKITVE